MLLVEGVGRNDSRPGHDYARKYHLRVQSAMNLSKADVRRALVRHHFSACATPMEAFERLRSVQFDPIAPVGCNHDLVLQARVPGYKIGDWERLAYGDRRIFDGWDKQASLIPFEGWTVRRFFHTIHRKHFEKRIFEDHKHAVDAVLRELEARGPLMPKDFEFQERRDEWKGTWFGVNVTKQTLRALWHTGRVMTTGRKSGQHVYDLTERVVPTPYLQQPALDDKDAARELILDRHRAMGIVRPNAPPEVWSYGALMGHRKEAIPELVKRGEIVPVDVDGVKAHATPSFLSLLDQPSLEARVAFVAPLDQLLWDRKMIGHVFGFDYMWEIYTPEAKRRWGYYVLPVLCGDNLVARAEFYCRAGVLEMREWHLENGDPGPEFWEALQDALRGFMAYCSASKLRATPRVKGKARELARSLTKK